jgi:hypothetical protein
MLPCSVNAQHSNPAIAAVSAEPEHGADGGNCAAKKARDGQEAGVIPVSMC